jgi:outer membrane protein TolC
VQFAGTDELHERHLPLDNDVQPAAAAGGQRFEALARSVRDISLEFLIGRSLANKVVNLLFLPLVSSSTQHRFMQRSTRTACVVFILGMVGLMAQGQDLANLSTVLTDERAAGSSSPELTLEQAVEQAIANNSSLKTASLDTLRAVDDLAANKTKRLANTQVTALGAQLVTTPSFTYPAGSLGTYSATGPIPGTNQKVVIPRKPVGTVNVLIAQPLSTQYQLHLQLKALEFGLEGTRQDQMKTRLEVVDQVRRVYYAVVEAQSALDSLQASLPYYTESHRLALVNRGKETILESDLLNAEAQLLKIQNAISDASDRVASASERLNDLMGRDVHTQFRVAAIGDADTDHATPEAMEARALQNRPDVKKAKLQVQQANYDARAKKAEYIPDVSLAFSYYTTANFENIFPSNVGTVGMSFKWEPWDWGRRHQEYEEKRAKEEQAKVGVGATERAALLEVRNACRQLENTRRQLTLSDASDRAARQKLKEVQEQVKREAALGRDLFQAQSDLASADSNQQQALTAFWKARADLKKAIGEE